MLNFRDETFKLRNGKKVPQVVTGKDPTFGELPEDVAVITIQVPIVLKEAEGTSGYDRYLNTRLKENELEGLNRVYEGLIACDVRFGDAYQGMPGQAGLSKKYQAARWLLQSITEAVESLRAK